MRDDHNTIPADQLRTPHLTTRPEMLATRPHYHADETLIHGDGVKQPLRDVTNRFQLRRRGLRQAGGVEDSIPSIDRTFSDDRGPYYITET